MRGYAACQLVYYPLWEPKGLVDQGGLPNARFTTDKNPKFFWPLVVISSASEDRVGVVSGHNVIPEPQKTFANAPVSTSGREIIPPIVKEISRGMYERANRLYSVISTEQSNHCA